MTKQRVKGNIRVKRVLKFTNTNSLGITLPSDFVKEQKIKPGEFVAVELNDEKTSLTVKKIDLVGGQ